MIKNRNFWLAFSLLLVVSLLLVFFYDKTSSQQMQEVVGVDKLQALQANKSYLVNRIREESRELYNSYLESNKELVQKRYSTEGSIFSKIIDPKNIKDNGYLNMSDTGITDEVSEFISQSRPTAIIFSSNECTPCNGLLKTLEYDIAQLGSQQIMYISTDSPESALDPAPDQNSETLHITDTQNSLSLALGIKRWPTTLIFENGMLKGALPYRDIVVGNEKKEAKLYRQTYIMALLKILQKDSQEDSQKAL